MHKTYKTKGTCSVQIDFDIEDNKIYKTRKKRINKTIK